MKFVYLVVIKGFLCVQKFELKRLFLVFSFNIALKFKVVVSVVSGITLRLTLCTEMVANFALGKSFWMLKNNTCDHLGSHT